MIGDPRPGSIEGLLGVLPRPEEERDSLLAQVDAWQAEIIGGPEHTTTDLLRGVIGLYGGEVVRYPDILRKYQRVADEIIGRNRDHIVMRRNRAVEPNKDNEDGVEQEIVYAVLTDDDLFFDFSTRQCQLPTASHVVHIFRSTEAPVKRAGGVIIADRSEEPVETTDIGLHLKPDWKDLSDLARMALWRQSAEIRAGLGRVNEWAGTQDYYNETFLLLRRLSVINGVRPLEPSTVEQSYSLELAVGKEIQRLRAIDAQVDELSGQIAELGSRIGGLTADRQDVYDEIVALGFEPQRNSVLSD
jgi:hypothetical protein